MLTELYHFRSIFFKLLRLPEKLRFACVVFFGQLLLTKNVPANKQKIVQALTQRVRYCCPILTQIWVFRPIGVELYKLKYH